MENGGRNSTYLIVLWWGLGEFSDGLWWASSKFGDNDYDGLGADCGGGDDDDEEEDDGSGGGNDVADADGDCIRFLEVLEQCIINGVA